MNDTPPSLMDKSEFKNMLNASEWDLLRKMRKKQSQYLKEKGIKSEK